MSHPPAARALLLRRIRAAARAADARLRALWAELLAVLRTTRGFAEDHRRLARILRRVGPATADVLAGRLAGLYRLGYDGAARGVLHVLGVPGRLDGRPFRGLPRRRATHEGTRVLTEDDRPDPLAAWLLAPPTLDQVLAWLAPLVRPADYALVGTDGDRRVPEELARDVALSMSRGGTQREIALALRPHLDGSRLRAARAARTFGLLAAHQGQRDAWEGSGLVIGYRLQKTTVPDSRWWHRARVGTEYFFDPPPGRKGMAACPHPPLEPEDPGERPPGTPSVAWNCL